MDDLSKEVERLTEEANKNNPFSLRNSPIPDIDAISGKLRTEEEINEFLNSGKLTQEEINQIRKIAWQVTNEAEKLYPNLIKNDGHRKNIWIESFRQVLLKGLPKSGGRKRRKRISVPKRYVPKQLSKKDKKYQGKELKKSRKAYKKGKYYTRKKVKSFKSKVSPHIIKARKMYKIDKIRPTRKLAKASKCKLKGLKKMFQKGQGAYFSSGSRPNQTGHSWGYARMASAITGGKASAVDFKIIQENCSKKSRAYKLAKKAYKKYKKGTRRVKQVKIGGKKKRKNKTKKNKSTKKMDKDFKPNLTPRQMFKMGSFGGTYWRPIKSKFFNGELKNQHKKYTFLKDIPNNVMTKPFDEYDVKLNKYKKKVGTTLKFWENKGWMRESHPYGWVQWYCDYYSGKRSPDDERQIKRWQQLAGPNGRFRKWLVTMILKKGGKWDDHSISPAIRQTLQHWGYKLTKKDFENEVKNRKK